jgi:diguanylate cyclase (GGDEF)-like protein
MKFVTPAALGLGTCALVGAMWAGLLVHAKQERAATIEAAIERNDNLAVALEQYVTRTLQSADTITRYVKDEAETGGPDAALARLRRTGVLDTSLFQGIGVIDEGGDLIATTIRQAQPLNFADREHFRVHAAMDRGYLFVGKPVLSRLLNETSIPITRRINKPNGEFGGVVIAQVAPGKFIELYKKALLHGDDFISVTGLDGIMRARLAGQIESSGEDYSRAKLFTAMQSGPRGTYQASGFLDHTPRFLSYRVLPDYPLVVTVGASEMAVLADFNASQLRTRYIALLATAVLIAFALLLLGALVRRDRAYSRIAENERRLKILAGRDPLTKLPNRSLLNTRAEEAIARAKASGRTLAVLFMDLDNFKLHNDALGHASGDAILRSVAGELTKLVRDEDTVARLGGDEFVILLDDMSDARRGASLVAEKVRDRLQQPLVVQGGTVTISTSIGMSLYPCDGATLDELLRHADAAMYSAKESGRGRASFYTQATAQSAAERVFMEQELRKAIRLNQLEIHYQPKVNLTDGAPVGLEALLRWRHPQMGLVAPAEFIPIAEQSGLILPIGEWVLRNACQQLKAWQEAGLPPVPVAVNVSALQFKQPDIVAVVSDALTDSGLEASMLELELTESLMVGKPELVTPKLEELKELGVSLALDDFGTGYSNLQYLKRFPLDVLKIDQSFVSDLPENVEGASIAKAIISLAHSLGLRVVAEGIETDDQAGFLMGEGCEVGQGYLYSRPLPPDEWPTWLLTQYADTLRGRRGGWNEPGQPERDCA